MKRLKLLLTGALGTLAMLAGCETRKPPASTAPAPDATVESPTSAPTSRVAASQPTRTPREQMVSMYETYRSESFPDVSDITLHDLLELRVRQTVVLVDCREAKEQQVSMVEGAITKAEFEASLDRYANALVVPYCTIGYRSGLYTQELTGRGIESRNLIGGVLSWAHGSQPFTDADGARTHRVHVYGSDWDLLPGTHESVYPDKAGQ